MTEMTDKDKVDAYIKLYTQQMDRFSKTQDVEWKGNFGVWTLLAAAAYFAANHRVGISPGCIRAILFAVVFVHGGWLAMIHATERVDRRLWAAFRRSALEVMQFRSHDVDAVLQERWYNHPVLREICWLTYEVGMTILLCLLLFVLSQR